LDFLALFPTTSASIKFKKKLAALGIAAELLPVPRELSASCGVAVKFTGTDCTAESLDIEGIQQLFKIENGSYILIYP